MRTFVAKAQKTQNSMQKTNDRFFFKKSIMKSNAIVKKDTNTRSLILSKEEPKNLGKRNIISIPASETRLVFLGFFINGSNSILQIKNRQINAQKK